MMSQPIGGERRFKQQYLGLLVYDMNLADSATFPPSLIKPEKLIFNVEKNHLTQSNSFLQLHQKWLEHIGCLDIAGGMWS